MSVRGVAEWDLGDGGGGSSTAQAGSLSSTDNETNGTLTGSDSFQGTAGTCYTKRFSTTITN